MSTYDIMEKDLIGEWKIEDVCFNTDLPSPAEYWYQNSVYLMKHGDAGYPKNAVDRLSRFGKETWELETSINNELPKKIIFNSTNEFLRETWTIKKCEFILFNKLNYIYLTNPSGDCLHLKRVVYR